MPRHALIDVNGEPVVKRPKVTSFKWTAEIKCGMAEYLVQHFESYKNVGEKGGKKLDYLRRMRDSLKIGCTDQQMKNGFKSFLEKYYEIRNKLNSSGFGIDPSIDSSLDKGWVLKECPYFDTLDSVFGTRPNVTPPCVLATTGIGEIVADFEIMDEPVDWEDETGFNFELQDTTSASNLPTEDSSPITDIIKSSFSKIGVARKSNLDKPKTGIAAFTKLLEEKSSEKNEVEEKKLKLEEKKFEHQMTIEKERLKMEIEKNQMEIQLQGQQFEDKKSEREREIRKLELQIQLEQLKSKNNGTS